MVTYTERPRTVSGHRRRVEKRLESVGWGLFFLWVGIALFAELSIGIGLIGVGAITLGVQVARRGFELPIEGFWVVAGLAFLAGGAWNLYALGIPFAAVLFVGVGILLLAGAMLGHDVAEEGEEDEEWC